MIERYSNNSMKSVFSDDYKFMLWRHIEIDYLRARLELGDPLVTEEMLREVMAVPRPEPALVRELEGIHRHDVVAFINAWTMNMSAPARSQIHLGLTSSDLVDNALFEQLGTSVSLIVNDLEGLITRVMRFQQHHTGVPKIGRTHGQTAEPTTVGWRFHVWHYTLRNLVADATDLRTNLNVLKTPGAVGNMRLLGSAVARRVAKIRGVMLVPSTQVIPRQRVIAWAAWMLQVVSLVEEIALEIRLSSRSEVGEMVEGRAAQRAGSSAMPHKRNPVESEQLSGLGRVARAYFAAVAETAGALHNERDISNSSVERTAVPDLAELTAYMVNTVSYLVAELEVRVQALQRNSQTAMLDSALIQYRLQRIGVPYMIARRIAADWVADVGWNYNDVLPAVNEWQESPMDVSQFLAAMEAAPFHAGEEA